MFRNRNSCGMENAITFDGARHRARRLWLYLGMLAAIATIVAALLLSHASPPARATDLTLVYIGAEDCAPCRAWQNGDGAAFRQSDEFARITYVEVKAPHLHDVLKDENWPQQIRNLKGRLRQSDGVPLWLVVLNENVIEQRFGPAAWRKNILPTIRSNLR